MISHSRNQYAISHPTYHKLKVGRQTYAMAYQFGCTYTVPLLEGCHVIGKYITVEDFLGISISSILWKILEHRNLTYAQLSLQTARINLALKRGISCSNAIYYIRTVINGYIAGGSTINQSVFDLSKAVDEMNIRTMIVKLMNIQLLIKLLEIIKNGFTYLVKTLHRSLTYLTCSSEPPGQTS